CKWISERKCNDYSLKLHLDGKAHVSLIDLVNLNSNAVLSGVDAVFCGHCKVKTSQKQARDYDNPDLLMLEIVRVTNLKITGLKIVLHLVLTLRIYNYPASLDLTVL